MEIFFAAFPVRSRLAALALRPRSTLVPITWPLEWAALRFPVLAPLARAFPPFVLSLAAGLVVPFAALAMIAARPAALSERPRPGVAAALGMIEGGPARTAAAIVVWRLHCAKRYSRARPCCTAAPPWTPPAQAGMVSTTSVARACRAPHRATSKGHQARPGPNTQWTPSSASLNQPSAQRI